MNVALERKLRQWVADGMRIPRNRVIPADDQFPTPYETDPTSTFPYATVLVLNETVQQQSHTEVEAYPYEDFLDPPIAGKHVYNQTREALIQVSVFRNANREVPLVTYAETETGKIASDQAGFRCLRIRVRTQARDTQRRSQWEYGMVVDLTIGYTVMWMDDFSYPVRPEVAFELDC